MFKPRTIEFCGEKRKFQRTPNRLLKDYQKQLEDIQDEAIPFTNEINDLQMEIDEKEQEIDDISKSIDLLERLSDPDDDELRESMKLVRERSKIQKELNELKRKANDNQVENRNVGEKLDEMLREAYATFASKIFENFDKDEFEENAASTDYVVAQRLAELYRLAVAGASQKEVDKAYKDIVKDSFR